MIELVFDKATVVEMIFEIYVYISKKKYLHSFTCLLIDLFRLLMKTKIVY